MIISWTNFCSENKVLRDFILNNNFCFHLLTLYKFYSLRRTSFVVRFHHIKSTYSIWLIESGLIEYPVWVTGQSFQ